MKQSTCQSERNPAPNPPTHQRYACRFAEHSAGLVLRVSNSHAQKSQEAAKILIIRRDMATYIHEHKLANICSGLWNTMAQTCWNYYVTITPWNDYFVRSMILCHFIQNLFFLNGSNSAPANCSQFSQLGTHTFWLTAASLMAASRMGCKLSSSWGTCFEVTGHETWYIYDKCCRHTCSFRNLSLNQTSIPNKIEYDSMLKLMITYRTHDLNDPSQHSNSTWKTISL